ncbi:MAG: hypothetical protein HUK22_04585, partial [Thermoguttaceae bacterium]|nr:hypothetical protein [Thermoguttaceae bacterium]
KLKLASTPEESSAAEVSRRFGDWETVERLDGTSRFDVYSARPVGRDVAPYFLLKTPKTGRWSVSAQKLLLERERALGTLRLPRLAPLVDISFGNSRQLGFVVYPLFPGETLAALLARGKRFSKEDVAGVKRQLSDMFAELHRVGWLCGALSPSRVLLTPPFLPGSAPTATIVDLCGARRFVTASQLTESALRADFDLEADWRLDAFFDPAAAPEDDFKSLRALCEMMENSGRAPALRVFDGDRASLAERELRAA